MESEGAALETASMAPIKQPIIGADEEENLDNGCDVEELVAWSTAVTATGQVDEKSGAKKESSPIDNGAKKGGTGQDEPVVCKGEEQGTRASTGEGVIKGSPSERMAESDDYPSNVSVLGDAWAYGEGEDFGVRSAPELSISSEGQSMEQVAAFSDSGPFRAEDDEEYNALVEQVHALGPVRFVEAQKQAKARPLDVAGILGVDFPMGCDDGTEIQWSYLQRYLISKVYVRQRLPHLSTLEDAVNLVSGAKNIMVLTGAGISVSCGIPDFRSQNGLYAQIQDRFNLPEPECMFDIEYFRTDPQPFYALVRELFPGQYLPSIGHRFIKALETRGQLLRNYTQNIDTIESVAGIERVVYCHGSFTSARCIDCGQTYGMDAVRSAMELGQIPSCEHCEDGIVKPEVVFFGESLPPAFDDHLKQDIPQIDLLLVIGSSLKVQPVASIPDLLPASVPQILVNRVPIDDHNFDLVLLGDADVILGELGKRLGYGISEGRPVFFERMEPNRTVFEGARIDHDAERSATPSESLVGSVLPVLNAAGDQVDFIGESLSGGEEDE